LLDSPARIGRPTAAPFGFSESSMNTMSTYNLCQLDALRGGSSHDRLLALAIDQRARGILLRRAESMTYSRRPAWAHAIAGDPLWEPDAAAEMLGRETSAVVSSAALAGLISRPPEPFRARCQSR
jgi:hypothetical protein